MLQDGRILIGKGDNPVYLLPQMANRHGLIAGATGTGKTVTLRVLAEGFSDMGVPVFLADVKGDVSALALAGSMNDKIRERLAQCGVEESSFQCKGYPVRFWDVFGRGGIPVRATVTDVGPMLLSRLLGLSPAQEGILNIVFRVADDKGWELIDLKDLRAMLVWVAEHRKELTITYGNVSSQSVGAVQRALLALEADEADLFFGEPALDIGDWFSVSRDGRGTINLLTCVELAHRPVLYATFMLWMLSELYENLPEVGDADKPKLVFFFDEAHMLFDDAPKALMDKIVQVVKLVRSKGVGIYFITQSPSDIPNEVLAQLNNRVQHALRAYTPAEQKAVRVAAQSFRANPAFKTEDAICNMGTGVALVSTLDKDGVPNPVEQAVICPPQSGFTPVEETAVAMVVAKDPLYATYKDAVDNVSAYEELTALAEEDARAEEEAAAAAAEEKARAAAEKQALREQAAMEKAALREQAAAEKQAKAAKAKPSQIERSLKKAGKSAARTVGRDIGRSVTRGVLGTQTKSRAGKAASSFTSSLFSDLFSSFIK